MAAGITQLYLANNIIESTKQYQTLPQKSKPCVPKNKQPLI